MRILLVEDEHALAEALTAGLTVEGYAVDVADNGRDGLWMATENSYSALIVDVMLPGMNGYKLCAQLRGQGDRTPILVLTAKDGELDEIEALDTGADDFLAKPFSYPLLLSRLRALIRRGGSTQERRLRLGNLTVDLATRRCDRAGTEITLTVKEFTLLARLMRHPGRIVSKATLLDELWDFASAPTGNVVEVHISALRRKIDAPFGTDTVRTVRGAGYFAFDPRSDLA